MSPLLQTLGAASARAFGFTRGSAGGGNALELISTQLISTNTATVTFASIPQTYKHLQLRILGRCSSGNGGYVLVTLNSDSTSSYAYHYIYGSGAAVNANNSSTTTFMNLGWTSGVNDGAGQFGSIITDFTDYTSSTKNKTLKTLSGLLAPTATTNDIRFSSGVWLKTNAVTNINLVIDTGASFVSGSRFSLYGVKG